MAYPSLDYLNVYFNTLSSYTSDPVDGNFYSQAQQIGKTWAAKAESALLNRSSPQESQTNLTLKRITIFIDFLQSAITQARETEIKYLNKMKSVLKQIQNNSAIPGTLKAQLSQVTNTLSKGTGTIDYLGLIAAINALQINQADQKEYVYNQRLLMEQQQALNQMTAADDDLKKKLERIARYGPYKETRINPKTQKSKEYTVTYRTILAQIYARHKPQSGRYSHYGTYNALIMSRLSSILNAVVKNPQIIMAYVNVNKPMTDWDLSGLIADIEKWLQSRDDLQGPVSKLVEEYIKYALNAIQSGQQQQQTWGQQNIGKVINSRKKPRDAITIERVINSSTSATEWRDILTVFGGNKDIQAIISRVVNQDTKLTQAITDLEKAQALVDSLQALSDQDPQKQQASSQLKQAIKTLKKADEDYRKAVLTQIITMARNQQAQQQQILPKTLEGLLTEYRKVLRSKDRVLFDTTKAWLEKCKLTISAHGALAEYSIGSRVVDALSNLRSKVTLEGTNIQLKGDLTVGIIAPEAQNLFDQLSDRVQDTLLSTTHRALELQKANTGGTGEINVDQQRLRLIESLETSKRALRSAQKVNNKAKLSSDEQMLILRNLILEEISAKDYSVGAESVGVDAGSLGKDLSTTIDNLLNIYNLGQIKGLNATNVKEELIFAIRNSSSTAMAGHLMVPLKLYLITAAIFLVFDFGFADLPEALKSLQNRLQIDSINILNLVNVDGRFYPSSYVYANVLDKIKLVYQAISQHLDAREYLTSLQIVGAPNLNSINTQLPINDRWDALKNQQVTIELYFLSGLGSVLNQIESIFGNPPVN